MKKFFDTLDKNHPLYLYDFKMGNLIVDNRDSSYLLPVRYVIRKTRNAEFPIQMGLQVVYITNGNTSDTPLHKLMIFDLRYFYSKIKNSDDDDKYIFTLSENENLIIHDWFYGDMLNLSMNSFHSILKEIEEVE